MTHSLKLTLASAMAQKSTEEAPSPEIQANGDQSARTGTHAPSSLISDLNASVDPEGAFRAAQLALQAQLQEAADLLHYGPDLPRLRAKAEGRAEERARIRAIVMRLMGNEWSANQLLEEIGE